MCLLLIGIKRNITEKKNTKIVGKAKDNSYIYSIEIKVMRLKFEYKNPELFIALASILNTKGADIEMESDFEHWKLHHEIKYTNVPVIRGYGGPEGEGFSFRADRDFFGMSKEQLEASFPINIDGYKFEFASFFEFEVDDDRTWSESISFIVSKNGENVLK